MNTSAITSDNRGTISSVALDAANEAMLVIDEEHGDEGESFGELVNTEDNNNSHVGVWDEARVRNLPQFAQMSSPASSGVKSEEKPLFTQLTAGTRRSCTGHETSSRYHQAKQANLLFVNCLNSIVHMRIAQL